MNEARRIPGGWIVFGEGEERWQAPDPTDEATCEAAWKARYAQDTLTRADYFRLAEMHATYHHLVTHPSGAEYTLGQLRQIRRAVRPLPPPPP